METFLRTFRSLGVGRLIGIGAVFAVVLGAIVAIPAFASAADSPTAERGQSPVFLQADGEGDQPVPERKMFRHYRLGGSAVDITAELTGAERSDVVAALQEGESLASYAAGFGVSEADLMDAIVADAETRLAERVATGDMTQEEADEKLAGLQERLPELVNTEGLGPKHNCDDTGNPTEESTSDTI